MVINRLDRWTERALASLIPRKAGGSTAGTSMSSALTGGITFVEEELAEQKAERMAE